MQSYQRSLKIHFPKRSSVKCTYGHFVWEESRRARERTHGKATTQTRPACSYGTHTHTHTRTHSLSLSFSSFLAFLIPSVILGGDDSLRVSPGEHLLHTRNSIVGIRSSFHHRHHGQLRQQAEGAGHHRQVAHGHEAVRLRVRVFVCSLSVVWLRPIPTTSCVTCP